MTETEGLMGIKRASEFLGVHPNTLRNWERQGLISPYRIGGRQDRRYPKWLLVRIRDTNYLFKK